MRFDKTEVWGFRHALRGMRNPLESWDRSDSNYCVLLDVDCNECTRNTNNNCNLNLFSDDYPYLIGENDLKLAQRLIQAGGEHRKFLRQIYVSVDITAPLYWWKEMDMYKIGTTTNSTSTMHKLSTTPITIECFEISDLNRELCLYEPDTIDEFQLDIEDFSNTLIEKLESLRKRYLETNDKRYWKELIRWLPSSWLQTRTMTLTYENLLNMYRQRNNHKLTEWSIDFIEWIKTLPYANELIMLVKESGK